MRESGSNLSAPAFHARWIGLDPPRLLCWLPRHNTFRFIHSTIVSAVRLCIPFSLLGWLADCVRVSNQKVQLTYNIHDGVNLRNKKTGKIREGEEREREKRILRRSLEREKRRR